MNFASVAGAAGAAAGAVANAARASTAVSGSFVMPACSPHPDPVASGDARVCTPWVFVRTLRGGPQADARFVRSARDPARSMPLTLVTGPANAEKAGVVLDRLRAALDREPILVVPTSPDVERYRRELAGEGFVFGVRVETFDRLLGEVARRAGVRGAPLGTLARERVAARAAEQAGLAALGASAATPGFPAAACRLFDELEEERITPQRFIAALRAWAAEDAGRRAYGDELGRLYASYRSLLGRLGRNDAALHHAAALDAIREEPARWGTTPVLFYGFDDLTAVQRDAIGALAATEAPVTASLTYEPGRHAFAARGETFAALQPLAAEHLALRPNADHYAAPARAALHALERGLFEGRPAAAEPEPAPAPGDAAVPLTLFDADPQGEIVVRRGPAETAVAGDAITFLEGGGERAELELVAAEVARLLRDEAIPPRRSPSCCATPRRRLRSSRRSSTPTASPSPCRARRRWGTRRWAAGSSRCCARRPAAPRPTCSPGCARPAGSARAPRRPPGGRRAPRRRRDGGRGAPAVGRRPPRRPARRAGPHRRGGADGAGRAARAPRRRARRAVRGAAPPAGRRARRGRDRRGRVLREGRRALRDLRDAAAADPRLVPPPAELAALLAGVDVRLGDREVPGAVQVADPQALRARRVTALFLCRLQERTFPAPARPEPFLGDDERRALNAASGLRLRAHEDVLGAERYLLYATVSRPQRLLALSWHAADDEGDPAVRSAFVDDVALLFGDDPLGRRRHRDLGAVGWPGDGAPCARERARAEAHELPPVREPVAAPLTHPEVLAELRGRETWAASGLETWASCPVKWFVERLLKPEPLVPDPEPMIRGTLAHKVLEEALRRLVDGGGLTPARLPEARDAVRGALDELDERFRIRSTRRGAARCAGAWRPTCCATSRRRRTRAAVRAARTSSRTSPSSTRATGSSRGQVDRIDVREGTNEALLYDYNGKTALPGRRSGSTRALPARPLRARARKLLGLSRSARCTSRSAPRTCARAGRDRAVPTPTCPLPRGPPEPEAFEQLLTRAVEAAVGAAREARDGALEPRPDACAWTGGCAYPTICRCEA
jgi:hypothetical protein